MSEAELLSGSDVVPHRRLTGASVQEMPLEDFVRKGELVLTTGIGLSQSPSSFSDFVATLASAEAGALGIAIGPHVSSVPKSIVALAESVHLPIIQLPWRLRFSEISEVVLERVLDHQKFELRRSESIGRIFTQLVLEARGLPDVADRLRDIVRADVEVIDRWGDHVAGKDLSEFDSSAIYSISAGGRELGNILVHPRDAGAGETVAYAHATTAAALIMLRDEAAMLGQMRSESQALMELLGSSPSQAEVRQRAQYLQLDPSAAHKVMCIGPRGENDLPAKDELSRAISGAMNATRIEGRHAWFDDHMAILIRKQSDPNDNREVAFLSRLVGLIERADQASRRIACGIGRTVLSLETIGRSYREACVAYEVGRRVDGDAFTLDYASLVAYAAIWEAVHGASSRPAMTALIETYLDPVIRYESKHRLELINTLVQYFNMRGNAAATARRLGINRQSLLYRLNKIETLLGVELDDPEAVFSVEFALRAWRVQTAP